MSKQFFSFREQNLDESIETRGQIRDAVNRLSSAWWDDYESNGQSGWFKNGKGLCPVNKFGLGARKKNGVLVVGINGASSAPEIEFWKKVLDDYDKGDQATKSQIRATYEDIYGKGDQKGLKRTDQTGGGFGGKLDKPEPYSAMRSTTWMGKGKRPPSTSEQGLYLFQANLNKLLDDWGEPGLRKRIGSTNFVPWPSTNVSQLKPEHYKLSGPLVSEIMKFLMPKLLITPHSTRGYLEKFPGFKLNQIKETSLPFVDSSNKTKVKKIWDVSELKGPGFETAVWFMPHWSGLGGKAQIKAWKESQTLRDECKEALRYLIGIQTAKRQIKGLG